MKKTDEEKAVKAEAKAADKALEEKVKVTFLNDEDGYDITPCVNGRAWQIKRDEVVELPRYVLHALDNAVMTIEKDGQSREVKRFPYSVVA